MCALSVNTMASMCLIFLCLVFSGCVCKKVDRKAILFVCDWIILLHLDKTLRNFCPEPSTVLFDNDRILIREVVYPDLSNIKDPTHDLNGFCAYCSLDDRR